MLDAARSTSRPYSCLVNVAQHVCSTLQLLLHKQQVPAALQPMLFSKHAPVVSKHSNATSTAHSINGYHGKTACITLCCSAALRNFKQPAEVYSRLRASAIDIGRPGYDPKSGFGFVAANRIKVGMHLKQQCFSVCARHVRNLCRCAAASGLFLSGMLNAILRDQALRVLLLMMILPACALYCAAGGLPWRTQRHALQHRQPLLTQWHLH